MKTAVIVAAALLLALMCAQGSLNRGVWFWGDSESPYGSVNVVGVPAKEDSTIAFLTAHGVERVYGSYQNRPVSEPPTVKAWNAKLHAAGIESQCLFSDSHRIFPAERGELLTKIENRVILFNEEPTAIPVPERFDAIHLDLEPQALPDWGDQSAASKRSWLLHLRDTYADIRALLVSHGLPDFPVFADLPVWFDKLPSDGGQVGWLDTADRDQWYADIMASLTGVSLMPFQQPDNAAVQGSMTTEHALIAPAKIRIGHMCDVGETWPSYVHFKNMMYWMEWHYGSRAVDIQSYTRWRSGLLAPGVPALPIEFALADPPVGGEIVWIAGQRGTHVLLESTDLCRWSEVRRLRVEPRSEIRVPFEITGSRKFWQVLDLGEMADPQGR